MGEVKMKNSIASILSVIGNLVFFIGVLIVNGLANTLPIGGNTTGGVAESFPSLFTPAGITFSIWGIIYLLLLLFSVYQIICLIKKNDDIEYIRKINIYFILSCIFNMIWMFAWHHEQILLSFIIMLFILSSLILIYLRLRKNEDSTKTSSKNQLFFHVPFSVYLGWITVATIANTSTLLVKYNWNGFGIPGSVWTIIVLIAALIIGILFLIREKDIFFNLVLIWAFTGIIIKRASTRPFYIEIIIIAGVSIAILIFLIIINILNRAKVKKSSS